MTDDTTPVVLPTEDRVSSLPEGLTEMGRHEGKDGPITLYGLAGEPLVTTETWKLFAAGLPNGQLGLMMIATSADQNPYLDWAEYMIATMQELAARLNTESATAEFAPNYDAFFPRVIEHIDTDDGRVALVLGYHPVVSTYKELRPLSAVLGDHRTDLKSVMWMLGKSLKLADFFHSTGCTIGNISADNLFVCTETHGVFYLDMIDANEDMSAAECREEISQIARVAWMAAGGTDTTEPPYDSDIMTADQHRAFVDNLKRMMDGKVESARTEFDRLYALNDEIWPKVLIEGGANSRGQTHKRQWHPFRLL